MNDAPTPLDESVGYLDEKTGWVADQLKAIDASGDTGAASVLDRPVVVVTMLGAKSGKLRRVPLMRVEHDGSYAAVASKGGAPEHPAWFHNIATNPDVLVQDGTTTTPMRARMLEPGQERDAWWERAVAAYPPYAEYQTKTDRLIPVFVLEG
ncbi:MAG: nitroreductase family deazaflavin-dependent oxidoreductase [Actinomycetales bacterium]